MSDAAPWGEIAALVEAVRALDRRADQHSRRLDDVMNAVHLVHDDDRTLRRELRAARRSVEYAAAYEDPNPLVSVVIPTWRNARGLREVSLPSVLAQTHENIEVVIVGDAAPREVEDAVASFGDDRIRFVNLKTRGPYPKDPRRAWLCSGTPPFNLGAQIATGSWIAPHGDDDEFTDDHVEALLAKARADRLEFVYGKFTQTTPGNGTQVFGAFPPDNDDTGLQMALYPSALRFFELELGDAAFDVSNDHGVVRRMLRTGVRFGMVDQIVTHYYPSATALARHQKPVDEASASSELGRAVAARVAALEEQASGLADRVAQLEHEKADAERRLREVVESKSWRLTRPLRDAVARRRSER